MKSQYKFSFIVHHYPPGPDTHHWALFREGKIVSLGEGTALQMAQTVCDAARKQLTATN
jgi:hypothetical protein